eukprot:CAMPEP_0194444300 /NCGR_PEP_ID=MMETSP0176-20130528/127193_1 /TAXON_ID=216777 /ORGANISM="Proboscia alata, Strain PI-D3" /LENGTH=185 /DNA_ID=CAMNT_0039270663 /DNA_START=90 /DNA_END=648 /DNA_ORIENTATION=-
MPPSHLLLDCSNNSPTATLYESGICLPPLPPLVDRMSSCSSYESDENSMIERRESLAMLVGSAPRIPLLDDDEYSIAENSIIERIESLAMLVGCAPRIPLLDDDEYSDCISCSSTTRSGPGWKLAPRQNTCTVDEKYYSSDDDSDVTMTDLQEIESFFLPMDISASFVHTGRRILDEKEPSRINK